MMKSNRKTTVLAILLLCLSVVLACAHTEKVLVPPRVDLKPYKAIGIIDFSSTPRDDLCGYVTQHFIQTVQSAQPGVRFLELGSKEQVLSRIARKDFDPDAIRSIGRAYNVDALMFGHLTTTDPKPTLRLSSSLQSLQAGAVVEASLSAKIWETDSGVILWTNSTAKKKKVAGLRANANGDFKFGASDPEDAYGQLVPEMIYANTADFRSYYEYRKVK